jgi:CBS domain-containing protein
MVTVGKVMSKKVVTTAETDSVFDACKLLRDHKIGSLIIISEKKAVGIITERDVIERVICNEKDPKATKVKDVMSRPLITVDSLLPVGEAAKLMSEKKIKKLGVVTHGRLIGVITTSDIVRAEPKIYDEFIKQWVEPSWTD